MQKFSIPTFLLPICYLSAFTHWMGTSALGDDAVARPVAAASPEPAATQPDPQAAPPPGRSPEVAPTTPFPYLLGDWFGARGKLADLGLTYDASFTADGTKVLSGGLDTRDSRWRRIFELGLTLDTQPLLHLQGGTLFVDFQNAIGPDASDKLVGDLQGIDGLDGVPGTRHQNRTQLSQLWYQQIAFDGALRIKVGKVDANTDFDHSDIATNFLQQSTGASATLITLPTYPDPATSINIFVKPNKDLQFGFGLYDGSLANGITTGSIGPKCFFRNPRDLFLIGEIDQAWTLGNDKLPGRLAIGTGYSTNEFQRLNGANESGLATPYLLLDQALWRFDPGNDHDTRGLDLFINYGYANPAIVPYNYNIGGGVAWTGPIPSRPNDIVGIGAQAVHFSGEYRATDAFEVDYELFYRLQVVPGLAIKPDLQYIANPGGQGTRDALALTVRFEIHL